MAIRRGEGSSSSWNIIEKSSEAREGGWSKGTRSSSIGLADGAGKTSGCERQGWMGEGAR